ncbi:MAG: T9SS type A sorting domain-containing protein, partial [Saprospiraceae bacterium]|nr:T9SS type A sorting domain-containing protein [Saprospiraceae bacterium]
FSSDTFQRTIQIEEDLEFQFGTVEWVTGPQVCAGGNAIVRIVHPALNMSYFFALNGEVISQQLALDTNAIVFQTPFLQSNATLKVFASITSFCGTFGYEEELSVEIIPFPNANLNWSITDNVCVNSQAQVTIQNSQPGMRYWLVESGIFTVSDTVAGTGSTLSFFSKPLTQPVGYQVRATNSIGCMTWVNAPIQVNIDFFYLMLDTTHLYGVVNQPISVNNFTENLGASNWSFGASAQPATSQSNSPVVTYNSTGLYPYSYQYQSQFSCLGTLQGNFEVFEQAANPDGATCWSQPLLNAVYGVQHILDTRVDPSGNYWVTGASYQQVGFWNTMNLFLNKYDPSGVLLWSKQVDPLDPANSFDYRSIYGTSIAFDPDGNAYLTGSYSADNARIFGVNFTRPTVFISGYGQGFLFKLSPAGDVIWHSNFQSLSDYDYSIPSSIVYHNNRLHLVLKGHDWQMIQPDGNSAINGHPNADAWYIALDTDGNFVQDMPILTEIPNSLYGYWHPDLISISTDLTTFRSPRLLVSPSGNLLLNGVYSGLSNITIGGITVEPLDSTFSARNHFIAAIDPETGVCEQAFCAYGIQTPQNDFPAWAADEAGDIFLGFGLNGFTPTYTPAVTIGSTAFTTSPNRSFIAKFSENGNLLKLQRHTDQVFSSFVQAEGGGIWALSRFDRSVGFYNPDGSAAGTNSNGGNDLLLSRLDADGALLGLQHIGGPEQEQPVTMVAAGPTLLGIFSADGLNTNLNGPANPYTLRVWSTDETECPALSVPSIAGVQEWSVNPNPFSDAITCTFELEQAQKDVICRLRSLDGRLQWSQSTGLLPVGTSVLRFDTEQLTAGVYFFEITTQQGTSVRKIIKWKS